MQVNVSDTKQSICKRPALGERDGAQASRLSYGPSAAAADVPDAG